MFKINDKVVCVDDKEQDWEFAEGDLVQDGKIYCIRDFVTGLDKDCKMATGLLLVGLTTTWKGIETGYNATRFRKVGRKTEYVADESAITERIG